MGRNIIGTRANYTSFKICVVMNGSKSLGRRREEREREREREKEEGDSIFLLRKMHNKRELVNIGAMTFSLL